MRSAARLVLSALVATTRIAVAQQSASVSGTVTGSVVDAATGVPLASATVTLSAEDGFGLLTDRTRSPGFSLSRSTSTSTSGDYRFSALPLGFYHLYIQRVGYAPANIDIRLVESTASPVSVGLVVVPVRLRAMEIRATDSKSSDLARFGNTPAHDRIAAARNRQREFLSTDARELTTADVAEGATFGGNDVLRAMQRLPGVTQFDDWSAKLWVRGNRWDQSRVYYDDLPLFDPLQALGRGSGVSADAIGGAFLHPGVRPVTLGGEGAARIDLRSRPAAGAGDWRGATELSFYGLSGVVERERKDQDGGFVVSASRSIGSFTRYGAIYLLSDPDTHDAQVTGRGDWTLGGGRRIEASALMSNDDYTTRGTYGRNFYGWGNAAGRVTFVQPMRSLTWSNTVGITHFASHLDDFLQSVAVSTSDYVILNPQYRPVTSGVDYVTLRGVLAPATGANGWSAGYDVINQRSSFAGLRQHLFWGDTTVDRASRRDALSYASVWGDRRVAFGERWTVEGGLRLDAGGGGLNAVRPAPSRQARYVFSDRTSISAGAGRTYQYVQSVDLPIVSRGKTAPGLWITSGGDVQPMAADNVTIGVEHWMDGAVLVGANAYVRRTASAIIDDPRPGSLIDRPMFVSSSGQAHGVELSARKLAGPVTGIVAYTYARATTSAEGLTFLSPADRTHALDATAMVHAGRFRVGAGFAWTSGAPYTRTIQQSLATELGAAPSTAQWFRDAPNALRAPNYASLDLFTDYTRPVRSATLSAFIGIQNIAAKTNQTWYSASGICQEEFNAVRSAACRNHDFFESPVKFAPTLGLRLTF